MEGRIDYVRIRVSGEKEMRIGIQQEYQSIAQALTDKHGIERRSYDDSLSFDRVLKRWYTNFNVWGELADHFFDNLTPSEFNRVHRLDYRVEVQNDNLDIELIGDIAIKHAKRKGLRRSFNDGPIQSKSNGRDVGGPSVVIGGVGSARRISLYKRGHEKPGVEAQISGERLKKLIAAVSEVYDPQEGRFHEFLRDAMYSELDLLCRERLCYPLSAFGTDGEISTSLPVDTLNERVYEQMSLLWVFMDTDKQEEFRNVINDNDWVNTTNKFNQSPVIYDDDAEMDRMEAYDAEMRQSAIDEDNERLNAEIGRITRDWPYHDLPAND